MRSYTYLPATWEDDDVYADCNQKSGLVFLANSEYQALVLTPYGVMEHYTLPYDGQEGTILELAEYVMVTMQTPEGATVPMTKAGWHADDAEEMYRLLVVCIDDFDLTDAPVEPLHAAKEVLLRSVIAEKIPQVAKKFRAENDNWKHILNTVPVDGATVQGMTAKCLDTLLGALTEDDYKACLEMVKHEVLAYLTAQEK